MEALDAPVIYPVHPRNHARAERLCSQRAYRNLLLTQPVGYQTSISLVNRAEKIVTDSGGVQREAFFAKKPCVTVLDYVGWPETMVNGYNQLARPEKADILEKLSRPVTFDPPTSPSETAIPRRRSSLRSENSCNDTRLPYDQRPRIRRHQDLL